MPRRAFALIALCGLQLTVSGCGCWTRIKSYWGHHFNVNGALLTVDNDDDNFQRVDLVASLMRDNTPLPTACSSPNSRSCLAAAFREFYKVGGQTPTPTPPRGAADSIATSVEACSTYANRHLGELEKARNRIQDQLIAASIVACSDFEQQLNTFQANSNFLLGLASIGAGAAGGITTSATAARALAGSAAAISGIRAEWNTDLFAKMLVSTITKAINIKRDEWLVTLRGSCVAGTPPDAKTTDSSKDTEKPGGATPTPTTGAPASTGNAGAAGCEGDAEGTCLASDPTPAGPTGPVATAPAAAAPAKKPATKKSKGATPTPTPTPASATFKLGRQQLSIDVYSVEAAVGDALIYNDLCGLDRGLEFVNTAVDAAANPGLDAMKGYLDKLKDVNTSLKSALSAASDAQPTATPKK